MNDSERSSDGDAYKHLVSRGRHNSRRGMAVGWESVFKEGNRYESRKGKSWAHTSLACDEASSERV